MNEDKEEPIKEIAWRDWVHRVLAELEEINTRILEIQRDVSAIRLEIAKNKIGLSVAGTILSLPVDDPTVKKFIETRSGMDELRELTKKLFEDEPTKGG